MNMLDERSWDELRATGLLWWINRTLHLFGWAICVEVDDDDLITAVYPARCKYRGFSADAEVEGFRNLTEYLDETHSELLEDLD